MKKVKLSSHCIIKNGYAFKSNDYVSSGYRVIRITNVQKGIIVDDDPKFVSEKIADEANNFKLKVGDILISLTGNVGRVGRIQEIHLPAVLNQRVGLIRTQSREIDDDFIFQYVNSDYFEKQAIKNANGIAQLNLSSRWLENHLIPVPPLNDQIRIAHLLGKVEQLIASRKQYLQQLDELLKSVFFEMFGPSNQDYDIWPLVEIRELAAKHKGAMRTGPFGSNLLHSEFTEKGEVAVLGIDNAVRNHFAWGEPRFITNEKYQELESYRIYPGDVIVTIMGTIGRSAVIPDDIPLAINTKHLAAITLNRKIANPLFLSYSIHSSPFILNQFRSKNRGAIMSGLNLGLIKETKLKRPPIELQDEFAKIHTSVDALKSTYQQSLTDLEALYGVLSQKAFKGELDLSRIPLPSIEPEEEKTALVQVIQDSPEEECEFGLPDIDSLPIALDNTEARKTVLIQWLKAYSDQLGSTSFSLQHLMAAAQTRLTDTLRVVIEDETTSVEYKALLNELYPNDEIKLDANDYDFIKGWVFKALKEGTLTQVLDDAGHCVQLEPEAVST